MKTLVVYYSLTGNTKFIANTIANTIEAETLELIPVKEIVKKGFLKYLVGGKQALIKDTPELQPIDKNPQDYGLIFVGTPVWAWTYSSPLNTFFSTLTLKNKKIAFFCCSAGSIGSTLNNMQKALFANEALGNIDFVEPLKKDKGINERKAAEWAQKIFTIATNG